MISKLTLYNYIIINGKKLGFLFFFKTNNQTKQF